MSLTETLFNVLATRFEGPVEKSQQPLRLSRQNFSPEFDALPVNLYRRPYRALSFIPTLEQHLATALKEPYRLPNLEDFSAEEDLQSLYNRLNLALPTNPTLPRLLDDLCSTFIENTCVEPTWITHHPAVMSPLAKSFVDDEDGQLIAARAELFIQGEEYVNCYEEENSPIEQRRKFLQQKAFKERSVSGAGAAEQAIGEASGFKSGIDESYIEALEWGMPPTGGWGCGVDRIVMLFAGAKRIADVLPFGNLRNVVALGKPWRK